MSLYILPENQKLLWDTMNKTPQYQQFGQSNPSDSEAWFRGIIRQIYDSNKTRKLSLSDLQSLNRDTVGFMMKDLNRMGFSQNQQTMVTRDHFSEKKQNDLARDYDARQKEYNGMLKLAPIQEIDFRIEAEAPIENMEELIRKQILERNMDVPPPIAAAVPLDSGEVKKKVSWAKDPPTKDPPTKDPVGQEDPTKDPVGDPTNDPVEDPTQQYPPGTRENCGTFSSIIHVTQNGTNFEVPKGGRGLESAKLILMKGGPGVPPNPTNDTIGEVLDFTDDPTLYIETDPPIDIRNELATIKNMIFDLTLQIKEVREFLMGSP